ncbi:hypothetical protein B0T25DRAFT_222856 [Lasiosphaeria hispida]|uniref:Cyclin-dependent kinase n=1 Tax=Lasiosphaeria hispida TaxID=260671 RepID=A0AAJ0HK84_9PEZI|nr:hypothetical protein B0T25DRAFT_222856 [Lasiosphaeria hispida]
MDVDSPSVPRFDSRRADKDDTTYPLSAPSRAANLAYGKMHRQPDSTPKPAGQEPRPSAAADATSFRVAHSGSPTGRDLSRASAADSHLSPASRTHASQPFQPPQPLPPTKHAFAAASTHLAQPSQRHRLPLSSSSNSQDRSSTNDADLVFTPPASEGGMSPGNGSTQDSSQESQLLQLSQIAAAQERIPDGGADAAANGALSKKRTADGAVKHTRSTSSVSPVLTAGHGHGRGHSRNTSTVSMASTTGSRIGELSEELRTRLQYAMLKVNHGWQGQSIEQVETLASQATSPTSSNSTIHLRNGSSASPQLSQRGSNNTTPATGLSQHFPNRRADSLWRESARSGSSGSPTSPVKTTPVLAPAVSIQPARHLNHPRRNSNPKLTPTFLSHASPNAGPHTPAQPSPYLGTTHQRTPVVDPILYSPHQNVREQDAIESLLFMSSPGNSANLKHTFPSSSQPLPSGHGGPQRTALPTSQPRKSLPSGRPIHHARSQSQTQKRVGFEKSPGDMDIDEPFGTPQSRGTPRRRFNGSVSHGYGEIHVTTHVPGPRLKPLPLSTGLMVPSRPRPVLGDEDIERMLTRAGADDDDSDSEGEIQIPVSRARRDGARPVGA